ncbi:hypothetical protein [Klenkia taihuensis]|uniref:Uncharacterized protein n=1 Tax=Klenkia taihuensis TaxID=1225127 RepID=A0A1I1JB51_9ACTN|nr:hypothetical protein [Klenkia taihuensis]GHE11032.1 hypothetical protein GCM10011381_22790 [Klenkia taihuensis]SFC45341.1 hypothetical protein SAMN05661030_0998 [Klenkia taihuensis]
MGKHSALDGATVHPLVADALERRQQGPQGPQPPRAPNVVQHQAAEPGSTAVGWPAETHFADGLGWPGADPVEPLAVHPADDGSVLAVLDAAAQAGAGAPEQPTRRTGWRRFFGGGQTRPTTAA